MDYCSVSLAPGLPNCAALLSVQLSPPSSRRWLPAAAHATLFTLYPSCLLPHPVPAAGPVALRRCGAVLLGLRSGGLQQVCEAGRRDCGGGSPGIIADEPVAPSICLHISYGSNLT